MAQFAETGIQFGVITPDRTEEVLQFLAINFYPDEPLQRSLGIQRNWFIDGFYEEAIKGGSCVMATDTSGAIIGVRLTEVIDRHASVKKFMEKAMMASLPVIAKISWLFRKRKVRKCCVVFHELIRELEYDVWPMFDQFDCQKILGDIGVCTSKDSRVKGLGTELVKQAEVIGKEHGCEYAINFVTGLYSGKIFRDKCNYTVTKKVFYSQFLDRKGNLHLQDTREHLSCFACHKKL